MEENNIEPVAQVAQTEPEAQTEPVASEALTDPVKPEPKIEEIEPKPEEIQSIKYSEGAKFNGVEVEVEIPADLIRFGAEKGVNMEALSKELYSSEDFTLSEESLNKAYKAFGKWQVDTYLSGLKASNEVSINVAKAEAETKETEAKAAWDATLELMGGEDRWDDMSAYAAEKMSDAELEEFNTVMQSGTLHMQQLMIKDLYNKFTEAGAPVAPTVLDLESGAPNGDPGMIESALSQEQYFELIRSGKYKENPAKYDQLRRAGMTKGI